jgi:hypothetical protein
MARKRVPPKSTKPQAIPLSDVTVAWKPRGDFQSDEADVTISGAQLGRVLRWMSHANHLALRKESSRHPDLLDARLTLSGVAEIMLALSETDLPAIPIQSAPIFHLLSRLTQDAMAVLGTAEDGDVTSAMLTVGRPATAEADTKAGAR